jgi:sugar (pentulose or hexulose) kinase
MKKKFLAGIDIGTTGAKAAIFDLSGNIIGSGYREYECSYPKPNWIEQDPFKLVNEAMEASREAVAKSKVNPAEIASLGFSTQRSCAIFVDREGRLLRPMISWQDSRCNEEVLEISSKIPPEEYYEITGFPNNTTWLLPEILWVRKNEPSVWNKTFKIIQLQDFTLKAFGAKGYFNDISDAGFSGMFDTKNLQWSEKILNTFGIDKNILSIPTASGVIAGEISRGTSEVSGFYEGMPICVGAGDQNSASTGAGVVYEGYASVSMGTAGNANAFIENPYRDPAGKNMVVNHSIYGKWQVEGHQAGAAGVFRWFRDEFTALEKQQAYDSKSNVYKLIDKKISEIPAGSKGLVFLPYLASATSPRWNVDAKGVLAGLSFSHDKWCIGRAFMEGITMEMKDILTSLRKSGINIEHIRIMGGATNSDLWNQMQSNVYNLEVSTLKVKDAAVLGASIMGGVGVGIFKDIREGVSQMVKTDKKFIPEGNAAKIYDEIYNIYCNIYDSMNENKVFSDIAKLQFKS